MDTWKVFIGGISRETSEASLREYFERFGVVLEAVIIKDRDTGRARGFGFIVFADCSVAERVLQQQHMIDGKYVEVKKAVPRDDHMILTKSNSSLQGSLGSVKSRKIFVGGLTSSVTEAEFKKYFAQFGKIIDAVVMYDHKTQRPRGFGFITYDSEEAVELVLQRKFHELDGKMVEVKLAIPKETSPNQIIRSNSFGSSRISTLLNDYARGYNLSPISSYGAKPEGRYSSAESNKGSFSPFGYRLGIDLKFLAKQDQSSGYNGGFRKLFNPGFNANPYPGQGDGYDTQKQLWGNNGGLNGNSGVGTIGEKCRSVGEGRSYRGCFNGEL